MWIPAVAGMTAYIKPDLVLIYRKPDAETLQLVQSGSHSELGL
jgi:mRNA interferase YafQ